MSIRQHRLIGSVFFDNVSAPESLVRSWPKSLDDRAGKLGLGLVYSTYHNRYEHLSTFATLVEAHQRPE